VNRKLDSPAAHEHPVHVKRGSYTW
jgi:hypothetical protein